MDDATLRTIWQQKKGNSRTITIAEPLAIFMKHHLARQVQDFGDISVAWREVLPGELLGNTALKSFNRGVLTVVARSASRRFQLQTFLAGGGLDCIRERSRRAINRIKIIPGDPAPD